MMQNTETSRVTATQEKSPAGKNSEKFEQNFKFITPFCLGMPEFHG